MKKFSAEFVLHTMMAALLVGIAGACTLGYYAFEQEQQRTAAAVQSGREVGAVLGLARATDTTVRTQAEAWGQLLSGTVDAAAAEQQAAAILKQRELAQRQFDDLRQAMSAQGLDAGAVSRAAEAHAQSAQAHAEGVRLLATGAQVAPPTPQAAALAPAVEAAALQRAENLRAQSAANAQVLLWVFAAFFLSSVLVMWFFRWWIRRANVGPLRTAHKMVQRITEGDLTASAEGMDALHTRKLAVALNEMSATLRTLISEVLRGARTVADTSSQIAQGNLDLSQRTEEQASTLEETASSMEELTSTVAHNADNARQASQLAVNASEVARKGGQVVGQVVTTMNDISASSRRIGDIIGVIDGIAFQTNILALNAAVEAARAGDQGRGFAVVAAEVRTLAQRSAAAAKEIKALIGDSVGKVETGTRLVDNAGKTMDEIVASVKKVSDLIAEIAAASQEQSAGIGQVNTAVAQMEQVVQQNASLVEEATAATESMKEQASLLLQAVSRFKVGDQGADHVAITPLHQQHAPARQAPPQPQPIKVQAKASHAALPPAFAGAAAAAGASRQPRSAANGGWEEF